MGVFDKQWRRVEGLRPEQWRVDRGRVVTVRHETGPRRITLLMDTSGSMQDTWSFSVLVAREFLATLRPGDQVALHAVADTREVVHPFTEDGNAIAISIVSTARLRGRTALFRALDEIASQGVPDRRVGDAVVVISDGYDSVGLKGGAGRLKRSVCASGLRIFLLRVPNPGELIQEVDGELGRVLPDLGGVEYQPAEVPAREHVPSDKVRAVLRTLSDSIHNFYLVEVEFPATLTKPQKLRLSLVDENNKRLDVRLVHPSHVYPASPGS